MSGQKIRNRKALQLRQKLGVEAGPGRFLFHKSSPQRVTVIPESHQPEEETNTTTTTTTTTTKSQQQLQQNDLLSDLPKDDTKEARRHKLDIISNCPPGQMDDFDGIDCIIQVRYVMSVRGTTSEIKI
ncbi:hypothetical protein Pmani_012006 [Petrolisthes manimaculis]|uniref:Uncharacterized protein n=1 Tax=Petrolisthes manimaculis TaxID=1843537 RepID=A0AAE1PY14_9EUCA|nr:hypothetical protein Pmani_012006 [Petrolisthes manimaculis]